MNEFLTTIYLSNYRSSFNIDNASPSTITLPDESTHLVSHFTLPLPLINTAVTVALNDSPTAAVFLNFKVWLAYNTPGKWVPTSAGKRAAINRPGRMGDDEGEEGEREGDLWMVL